jgi:hypothetical protein
VPCRRCTCPTNTAAGRSSLLQRFLEVGEEAEDEEEEGVGETTKGNKRRVRTLGLCGVRGGINK